MSALRRSTQAERERAAAARVTRPDSTRPLHAEAAGHMIATVHPGLLLLAMIVGAWMLAGIIGYLIYLAVA